ncbi:ATPase AAA [Paenibacillus naphthalenovorans]|uniref:ATPase AAA n=1 Tax=Paenibacillus naphthalenovorans TaxID=162209 RepID=A0A0U2VIG5_9BACL|nr:ATPase AAA [Paenibacillus naphthalenovorans]
MDMDLFTMAAEQNSSGKLLADRMRPVTLEEYIGQEHIVGPGKLLRRAIEADQVTSILLYGPPGTGKTTLAHIISRRTSGIFVKLNAVDASVKDVREVIDQAKRNRSLYGKKTILFLDVLLSKCKQLISLTLFNSSLISSKSINREQSINLFTIFLFIK